MSSSCQSDGTSSEIQGLRHQPRAVLVRTSNNTSLGVKISSSSVCFFSSRLNFPGFSTTHRFLLSAMVRTWSYPEVLFATPFPPLPWAGSDLFYRACQVNSPNPRLSKILPVMPCFQIISCGAGGNTTEELMDGGGACFWCQDFLDL